MEVEPAEKRTVMLAVTAAHSEKQVKNIFWLSLTETRESLLASWLIKYRAGNQE